jgi:hypothetical protein
MSKIKIILIASLVLLLSTACLSLGGLGQKALDKALEQADLPEGAIETAQAGFEVLATEVLATAEAIEVAPAPAADVPFPVTPDAKNLMNVAGTVNYQTSMSVDDVVAFYRQQLLAKGYVEREITTVIEGGIASLVFDGDPSGKALVVQVVGVGDASNVNVRLEDV